MSSFERLATYHQVPLRVIGFQRRLRMDHATLSYAKAVKMTPCESIETTNCKRCLFFTGGVARQSVERRASRVMFGTMAGGENPRPGGQMKTWHRCTDQQLREFRATDGSTDLPPWCLALRPRCGPLQPQQRRGSGAGGSLKMINGSWWGGTRLRLS